MNYGDKLLSNSQNEWGEVLGCTTALVVASVGTFVGLRYHVCKPEQFLVRTGVGIKDMSITKHAMQWPFQKASFVASWFAPGPM